MLDFAKYFYNEMNKPIDQAFIDTLAFSTVVASIFIYPNVDHIKFPNSDTMLSVSNIEKSIIAGMIVGGSLTLLCKAGEISYDYYTNDHVVNMIDIE